VDFRLIIWTYLAVYLLWLIKWKGESLFSVVFPLLLLLMLIFWGDSNAAYLFLAMGILSWVRSGICFPGNMLKMIGAEVLTCVGGGAMVAYFAPYSMVTWAMAIWMFFLVQSLYFFFVEKTEETGVAIDPFEKARGEAERILSGEH
jgi:hypothetical protein